MASHWKSTPSYWCKFCSQYVRDTPLERRKHESTGRHQGNIQRSLRELHKNKEREDRDKQRAKDEITRLNALVDGDGKKKDGANPAPPQLAVTAPTVVRSAAAERKARAEQLLAMGVAIPEELKAEVTGVSGWKTVSERMLEKDEDTSLAGILKKEEEKEEDVKAGMLSKGVHKRKAEGEAGEDDDVERQKRVWGSSLRRYPGARDGDGAQGEDLDALLSGVGTKKKFEERGNAGAQDGDTKNAAGNQVEEEVKGEIKGEGDEGKSLADVPPPVVFKKRKVKR